jgi:hypothetical protein
LLVGNEVNILLRADVFEAVVRPLNERTPGAEKVMKLLRIRGTAYRPEATANATGHDGYIIILNAHCIGKCKKVKVEKTGLF